LTPILAVVTALVIGAVIVAVSGADPLQAYTALWEGALGKPKALTETLVMATPYMFAGLAVALGFKAGLFNIGAEGQIFVGSILSVWVGFGIQGLPWFIHMPLAILVGVIGGAIWGAIPGLLKATTGAHEVINTIMMNYIVLIFINYLLIPGGPLVDPKGILPQTPLILESARLPQFWPPYRLHPGVFLGPLVALAVYWLLWKTTLGFEIRTVGANYTAAKYAGIRSGRVIVLTMTLSGALAGLAGAIEIVGLNYYFAPGFNIGYGFDSITVALLGKSHPFGVILAALLFGALRNGASRMQMATAPQIPADLVSILQAMVIVFIAAPEIVRWLYRLRGPAIEERMVLTRGWGR